MTDLVNSFVENNVYHIELNRHDKYNALTTDMYISLTEAFAWARTEADIHVILFKGGKGCFCAGNDIQDFVSQPVLSEGSDVLKFLHEVGKINKPLIAAVSGPAIGVATTFLLHCDLVYATESTVFSLPFVNLGLCPEAGSTYLLPRLVGNVRAAELLFFGDKFDALRALELGLINKIVDEESYWAYAQQQAEILAQKPKEALQVTKKLLKADTQKIHDIIDREAEEFVKLRDSDTAQTIFARFLNK